jgi:hypothetical protein
MIIVWAIVLAVFGLAVTESMFAVRKITPHEVATPVTSNVDSSLLDSVLGKDIPTVSGSAEPSNSTGTSTGSKN